MIYAYDDGTHGIELWESNGSAAGTRMVRDIWPGAGSGYPELPMRVGAQAYFAANDGVHGVELWMAHEDRRSYLPLIMR